MSRLSTLPPRALAALLVTGAACTSRAVPAQADGGPTGCQLPETPPTTNDLWPEPVTGPTACVRDRGLTEHRGGPWAVLPVRSVFLAQSHCAEMGIGFVDQDAFCPFETDAASLSFIANGPGSYAVVTDEVICLRDAQGNPLGPPPGQPPFVANAWRDGLAGTGVVTIEDAYLDNQYTRGSVDVVFPDHTRLLADFLAPLCLTE